MFGISYVFVFGLPTVELTFNSERALKSYARTWLTGEEVNVTFYHNGIEYTPNWA